MLRRTLPFFAALLFAVAAQAQTITPQGRLTLTSGKPVMSADVSAGTTVYYDCYGGNVVPVGASPTNLTIGSCEVSAGLAVANFVSGSVYDIFGVNNSGTLVPCIGPAWASTTSRGTGAGTTELDQTNGGLWTNKNSLTNCYGGAAGTTNYGPVAAHAGTALGCAYATSSGTTKMVFNPAGASGGTNTGMYLGNIYNRVRQVSVGTDSGGPYSISSTTPAAAGGTSNRVWWLDCIGQSVAMCAVIVSPVTDGQDWCVFNATTGSAGAGGYANFTGNAAAGIVTQVFGTNTLVGSLGLNFGLETIALATGSSAVNFFSPSQSIAVDN